MKDYLYWPLPYNEPGRVYMNNILYIDAVWLTSHNSFVNIDDGWNVHPQQKMNLVDQFKYGVRSFMIDVHKNQNQELILQHGNNFSLLPFLNQFGLSGVHHSNKNTPHVQLLYKKNP